MAGPRGVRPGLWYTALETGGERYLLDPLADLILRGEVEDGATVKVNEGEVKLELALVRSFARLPLNLASTPHATQKRGDSLRSRPDFSL